MVRAPPCMQLRAPSAPSLSVTPRAPASGAEKKYKLMSAQQIK